MPPGTIGLDLRSKAPRLCGVCGTYGQMTKAHVPPRAAGNTSRVTCAAVQIDGGVMKTGRPTAGGMWVRSLCADCNSLAGGHYDSAYGDFARRISSHTSVGSRLGLLRPWEAPAVSVAPGLVARSVMFGMFALSPTLRANFPVLGDELRSLNPHVRMPQGMSLRVALYLERRARLAGPVGAHRVLTIREDFDTFAEVFFRPLAWVLTPNRGSAGRASGASVLDRQGWANADDWLLYGPDVTTVDLRNLATSMPIVRHPTANSRDEWIEMHADEITPVLEGLIPA